jgi:IclR family transcriptional regulator, acetate operon repressor
MSEIITRIPYDGIRFSAMKNEPAYAVASVDHALHLAALLQQEGGMRVTDAATRLAVSPSTAHRLLAMLVYRDFAVQDADRRYRPGPLLRPATPFTTPTAVLRGLCLPHLSRLVDRVNETATLIARAGRDGRFVATVECDQILRVGDRSGRSLPLHLLSGGRAILAALGPDEVAALYADDPEVDQAELQHELIGVRDNGFAVNDQRTEKGLTAIGVVVPQADRPAKLAVNIAMPTARFDTGRVSEWVRHLKMTAARIGSDLARLN